VLTGHEQEGGNLLGRHGGIVEVEKVSCVVERPGGSTPRPTEKLIGAGVLVLEDASEFMTEALDQGATSFDALNVNVSGALATSTAP
jgi:hypothetical protein